MERKHLLENWIKAQFAGKPYTLQPASGDASFRRYFRVFLDDQTYIAMDAPPQHENCTAFLDVANILDATGVHVPRVIAQDLDRGFLLLSDLGNKTFLQAFNDQAEDPKQLYSDATDALIKIQLSQQVDDLPVYDEALLQTELNLFPEWYIVRHLKINLSEKQQGSLCAAFTRILQNNLAQPRVLVHRDYHCRNLMVACPNPGILDFQDAVYGPITYDLVSLFKDAYIQWDEEYILDWTIRYWDKARQAGLPVSSDFAHFYRDFEWMGVQRHLKVLGIFARLNYRDSKATYLNDMPRVMTYLRKACERYRELHPLLQVLDEINPEACGPKIGYTF